MAHQSTHVMRRIVAILLLMGICSAQDGAGSQLLPTHRPPHSATVHSVLDAHLNHTPRDGAPCVQAHCVSAGGVPRSRARVTAERQRSHGSCHAALMRAGGGHGEGERRNADKPPKNIRRPRAMECRYTATTRDSIAGEHGRVVRNCRSRGRSRCPTSWRS